MADVAGPLSPDSGASQLPRKPSALRSSGSTPRRAPTRVSIVVPKSSARFGPAQPSDDTTVTASPAHRSPGLSVTSTPWAKKLILTLDGGGIRGYSSLVILRAIMTEIAHIEQSLEPHAASSAHTDRIPATQIPPEVYREGEYLPCHYFDYIAGTSVGGLVAIMLGMMGKSADECIAEFHAQHKAIPLADDHLPRLAMDLPLLRRRSTWPTKRTRSFFDTFSKFSVTSTHLNSPMTSTAGPPTTFPPPLSQSSSNSSIASPSAEFKKDTFQCQTLAWCTEVQDHHDQSCKPKRVPYAFCSYKEEDTDEDEGEAQMDQPTNTRAQSRTRTNTTTGSDTSVVSIPEVAKAITTPSSSLFKPFRLGSGKFVDGSKQIRDPTLEVIKEISSLLVQSDDDDDTDDEDELSPTAIPAQVGDQVKGPQKKQNPPIDILLSLGTDEHRAWFYEKLRRPASENNISPTTSWREEIRQQEGLSYRKYHRFEVPDIKLGLRKKYFLSQIEEATEEYLSDMEVKKSIWRYAEFLVDRRRARAQTSRWETFALGVKYFCHHATLSNGDDDNGRGVAGCNSLRATTGFETRGDFYEHLEKRHNLSKLVGGNEVDIGAELGKGRRFGCI
ncbi:patatin-like phospholipase-domain-containing protein [Rhypophila decipiens]|uniref:Patatin-like phospholipase-domain-containing protein n=1 Tax=Rhypophila decipiens TaxID=261697 RepID=A0AAN7BFW6_9PEZI|nr:patatin-like phospholipase-domain-containing protein [Rhypophila decipiens]